MNQSQLERAIAQATGETRDTIRQRGFTLLEIPQTTEDDVFCNAPRCSAQSGNDRQQRRCAVSPTTSMSTTRLPYESSH